LLLLPHAAAVAAAAEAAEAALKEAKEPDGEGDCYVGKDRKQALHHAS
jgi:hypothetical protein